MAASVLEVFYGIFLAIKRRQRWSWQNSAKELFGMLAALLFKGHASVLLSGNLLTQVGF